MKYTIWANGQVRGFIATRRQDVLVKGFGSEIAISFKGYCFRAWKICGCCSTLCRKTIVFTTVSFQCPFSARMQTAVTGLTLDE